MLSPTETRPKELIVVDDDDLVHKRIQRNLRRLAWSVVSFLDPEEALAGLRRCAKPDLLLVDNRMPRMDGPDFIDRLRWPHDLMTSRVYLCSGVRPPLDVCAEVEAKGVEVLSKDVLFAQSGFSSFLDRHIDRQAA